jgi:hypothetical protein
MNFIGMKKYMKVKHLLMHLHVLIKKILDAKYEPADLDKIAHNCDYLTDNEQTQLLSLLHKYQHLFDGSLGTWNAKPYNIELKPDAKPYHSRPFPVPKIHEATLKIELERLTKAGASGKGNLQMIKKLRIFY